ncbi:hypothetical protein HI914_04007 [Erysiphe necator]|nr:hypothetical protein HI914_04007 [Erysiphe necator]
MPLFELPITKTGKMTDSQNPTLSARNADIQQNQNTASNQFLLIRTHINIPTRRRTNGGFRIGTTTNPAHKRLR